MDVDLTDAVWKSDKNSLNQSIPDNRTLAKARLLQRSTSGNTIDIQREEVKERRPEAILFVNLVI